MSVPAPPAHWPVREVLWQGIGTDNSTANAEPATSKNKIVKNIFLAIYLIINLIAILLNSTGLKRLETITEILTAVSAGALSEEKSRSKICGSPIPPLTG